MTPEEIKADKRLQRTYGITLAEYNQKLKDQGGVCWICRRPPVKYRLNVDHNHAWDRIKISVRKADGAFISECVSLAGQKMTVHAANRKQAREELRIQLRRQSVRALLCFSCNKGLAYYRDRPERFEAAAQYLRKFSGT